MKKILFNDKFGLTKSVLDGRKTQTRLIVPQKKLDKISLFQEEYYNATLDKLEGIELLTHYFFTEKRGKLPYDIDEVVAVAQSYRSIADELENSNNATCAAHYEKNVQKASEYISWMGHPGFNNKMFITADMMVHQICITDVRIEHLQDISNDDCFKEGIIKKWHAPACKNYYYVPGIEVKSVKDVHDTPQEAFAHLINNVSKKDVWSENPYVFVYDFELVK